MMNFLRWNMDEIEMLPDYLKLTYEFVMSVSEEFELFAEKQGKSFAIPYYIEAVSRSDFLLSTVDLL